MSTMGGDENFFEEDEPVADVVKAFDESPKGRTGRSRRGQTRYLEFKGLLQAGRTYSEHPNTVNLVTS